MPKAIIKLSICLILLTFALGLNADYYDTVINLTGQNLFNGLRSLISNNTNTSYDASKVVLFQTLDNTGGNVTCVYTGQVYNVGYNYNGNSNPNTEHTYAQSWFVGSETSKQKSDLHHLFVTNSVVNSSRGNYPLTTVANHSTANVYYTSTPRQSYRGSSASGYTVFEPADQFKGNIARALLYFNTRYAGNNLVQQNVDMLPVLLLWHVADPPDAAEVTRNIGVYNYQNNRNPYVDHPEFVGRIWGGTDNADDLLLTIPELKISSIYPNPFSSSLAISVDSKSSTPVTATVYNLKGQKVFYQSYTLTTGETKLEFDGKDTNGKALNPGIYFIQLESPKQRLNTKVLKL